MNHLLLYCRPGFESECALEIQDLAATLGVYGYIKAVPASGYLVFITQAPQGALTVMEGARFRDLIFVRQWVACQPVIDDMDPGDRVSAVLKAAQGLPQCGELWVETADTTEARALQRLCRKLASPCAQALRRQKLLSAKRNRRQPRMHLFMTDSLNGYVGVSFPGNSAPWEMGVLRLKFPVEAPSRSTLKLDEAWHWFLSPSQREQLLAPGAKAVDLGAAPGGWTWQLVHHHMRVTAVDNGPMHSALMDSGLVEHVVGDGFTYQPRKPVDWMVCDIADKPARVSAMVAHWVSQGWCRHCIFNLKLPMKKRYLEVQRCRELLEDALREAGVGYKLAFKHLYHDREEITGYLDRRDG